ncbi:MAG: hypothetical protein AAF667_15190 [Pseudomonadota bacterium]
MTVKSGVGVLAFEYALLAMVCFSIVGSAWDVVEGASRRRDKTQRRAGNRAGMTAQAQLSSLR